MRRAAFLDRDGVVNVDRGYVHRLEDFEFLPGVLDAAARLSSGGWTLVVVTNQSGIARGLYSEQTYRVLTQHMEQAFARAGAPLAGVYHCPHHPEGRIAALAIECTCRKPAPGLLLQARDELGLSLPDSVLVGDRLSDLVAARRAGVGRAYLLRSGPTDRLVAESAPDGVFDSLADCVDHLMA
jgi:D-glycero-D-manno-heptose 1,7-bisphosphate phosphatase